MPTKLTYFQNQKPRRIICVLVAFALVFAMAFCFGAPAAHAAYSDVAGSENYTDTTGVNPQGEALAAADLPDGTWKITASTSSSMAGMSDVNLKVKGDTMAVTFTLTSSYTAVYPGLPTEAALLSDGGKQSSEYIMGKLNDDGETRSYTMAISSLNKILVFSAYNGNSKRNEGKWYGRNVCFNSTADIDKVAVEYKKQKAEEEAKKKAEEEAKKKAAEEAAKKKAAEEAAKKKAAEEAAKKKAEEAAKKKAAEEAAKKKSEKTEKKKSSKKSSSKKSTTSKNSEPAVNRQSTTQTPIVPRQTPSTTSDSDDDDDEDADEHDGDDADEDSDGDDGDGDDEDEAKAGTSAGSQEDTNQQNFDSLDVDLEGITYATDEASDLGDLGKAAQELQAGGLGPDQALVLLLFTLLIGGAGLRIVIFFQQHDTLVWGSRKES